MNEIKNSLQFFRDCYQIDNKNVRISNFGKGSCEAPYVFDENVFFNEHYSSIPVESDWFSKAEKILFLNAKEKELYAGSYFIKGIIKRLGKTIVSSVPLYIHELSISLENDIHSVSIEKTFLNPEFINLASSKDSSLDLGYDQLTEELPSAPFGFDSFVLIENFFQKYFSKWDFTSMENYKNTNYNFQVADKLIQETDEKELIIFSCLKAGIFNKPQGTHGITRDLNELIDKDKRNDLLEYFFEHKKINPKPIKNRSIFVPTSLSEAQEESILKADRYPISMIIGPPGTGKSYTIASHAVDAISQNKSVLIITRNPQANRVISNFIEKDFEIKGVVIKAETKRYKRSLHSILRKFTDRKSTNPKLNKELAKVEKLKSQIEKTIDKIYKNEENEFSWGAFYARKNPKLFYKLNDFFIQFRKRHSTPIRKLVESLDSYSSTYFRELKKLIKKQYHKNLYEHIKIHRKPFLHLMEKLKPSTSISQFGNDENLDFQFITKAIPIWASTLKNVPEIFPLEKDLFDIVIFDEASQVDIASALPILYRARKAIVVGDPQQLRHLSFVSNKQQLDLKSLYDLENYIPDYRQDSLIDWTNHIIDSQNQITFLDEHFRSKADIIHFSNENFYQKDLKIIRAHPIHDQQSSYEIIKLNAKRNQEGVNKIEADKLIDKLVSICKSYDKITGKEIPSIGIISPFAKQVSYLKKALSEKIELSHLKKHDILVGTPFHFQGEEKDIMLLSFGLDDNSHHGSWNYMNKTDVFNVLVTRARNKMIIFHSFDSGLLPHDSLVKNYFETITDNHLRELSLNISDSFASEVVEFLISKGFDKVYSSVLVAGEIVDLVVIKNDKFYCIDLIAFPGEFEKQSSLETIKIFNRQKIELFFIPYSSWFLDPRLVKNNLLIFLDYKLR